MINVKSRAATARAWIPWCLFPTLRSTGLRPGAFRSGHCTSVSKSAVGSADPLVLSLSWTGSWIRFGSALDWSPSRISTTFADVRATGLLAQHDAERALEAAAFIERRLRQQAEPFDGRGDCKLFEAGQSDLPALVDVPHPFDI